MSERFVRLYGPGIMSIDSAAPTTLFTVPTGKSYVVRDIIQVAQALVGPNAAQAVGIYSIGSEEAVLVGGALTPGSAATQKFSGSIPVDEGQSFKGFVTGAPNLTGRNYSYANAGPAYQWMASAGNSQSTAGHSTNSCAPSNFIICSFAGNSPSTDTVSQPDVILNIGGNSIGWSNYTHIIGTSTTAGAGNDYLRADIGAQTVIFSEQADIPSGVGTPSNSGWTIRWVPATGPVDYSGAVMIPLSGIPYATSPAVGTTIVQTATATGTTGVNHGVTLTPAFTNSTVLLWVVNLASVDGSYNTPANYTQVMTNSIGGVISVGGDVACYIMTGANGTNPTVTYSGTPEEWCAIAIEIAPAQVTTTIDGIIVEK